MLSTIIIVVALAMLGYVLRRNCRRFWHVLYTGDMEPDWDKLGDDYFVADWERSFWNLPAGKKAAKTSDVFLK
jgi:hypothetical protein